MSNKRNDNWLENNKEMSDEEKANEQRALDDYNADRNSRVYLNEDDYLQSQGRL